MSSFYQPAPVGRGTWDSILPPVERSQASSLSGKLEPGPETQASSRTRVSRCLGAPGGASRCSVGSGVLLSGSAPLRAVYRNPSLPAPRRACVVVHTGQSEFVIAAVQKCYSTSRPFNKCLLKLYCVHSATHWGIQ